MHVIPDCRVNMAPQGSPLKTAAVFQMFFPT